MTYIHPGEVIGQRYRLTEALTPRGDIVDSYLALDTVTGGSYRAHVFSGPQAQVAVDQARRAALVNDPAFVTIHDALYADGIGFVITTVPVGQILVDQAPLAPRQARSLIGLIASALERARMRGLHHLALAPEDIIVGPQGELLIDSLGWRAALELGTQPSDAEMTRADAVAAVGLLYFALTGLWAGIAPSQAERAVRDEDRLRPATEIISGIPPELDTLCAVTLNGRHDGPLSPGELVAELQPFEELGPLAVRVDRPKAQRRPGAPQRTSLRQLAAFQHIEQPNNPFEQQSDAGWVDPAETAAWSEPLVPGSAPPYRPTLAALGEREPGFSDIVSGKASRPIGRTIRVDQAQTRVDRAPVSRGVGTMILLLFLAIILGLALLSQARVVAHEPTDPGNNQSTATVTAMGTALVSTEGKIH